ncbi:MAG: CPBP family glutamic-type intramembrane protease [Candidatus Poseidoniia archaeon]|jgi:membrane protease YdiL (CAAX protease family)|nr:CPBP family glutamic-type intramembrane protease [Candidatus Poseidoniia archaeon]MDP6659303.1 CPBP family glutamic-type intramembrane protease [Candidatus Poseidoniia archaeon]MDP6846767.1 CPBP family glutamic-type intramembrane protease [Candidatus Poseidoniia archaeon]|tara:strand:- start:913 stop:1983 length:1071 start_codon:yes stop_codon:yes gene_type:complete
MEREAELEILQAKLDSVLVEVEEIKNRINNLQEEKQAADAGGSTKISDNTAGKVPLSEKKIDFQTWLASKSQNIKDYTSSIDTSALHDKRIDLQTWISVTATNVQDYASGMEFSSINDSSNKDLRIWIFAFGFPFLMFLSINMIFGTGLAFWFTIIFGWNLETSIELAYIITSLASLYPTLILYSYCTSNRNFEINSDIFSEINFSVLTHLFRFPSEKRSIKLLGAGYIADNIGGFFILIIGVIWLGLAGSTSQMSILFGLSFISMVIIAPIFEEILFRGYVLDVFFERYGKIAAIILSALMFGFAHSLNEEPLIAVSVAIWGGLVYGYLRVETRSLIPGLLLHSIWNLEIILLSS